MEVEVEEGGLPASNVPKVAGWTVDGHRGQGSWASWVVGGAGTVGSRNTNALNALVQPLKQGRVPFLCAIKLQRTLPYQVLCPCWRPLSRFRLCLRCHWSGCL